MEKEVGTLQQLGVKPGDVVECLTSPQGVWTVGKTYLMGEDGLQCDKYKPQKSSLSTFSIVSRAIDTPKLWRDMTDAEQGALLLAHQRGKVIEWSYGLPWKTAHSSDQQAYIPHWSAGAYYRVRPEPKVETKKVWYAKAGATVYDNHGAAYSHKITFDLVDGEPDVSTVKMEKL